MRLTDLPSRVTSVVRAVDAAAGDVPPLAERLDALGFVPGEPVAVLRRAWPGGDPLVVRVGTSTYALRKAEAACVRVERPAATPTPAPRRRGGRRA